MDAITAFPTALSRILAVSPAPSRVATRALAIGYDIGTFNNDPQLKHNLSTSTVSKPMRRGSLPESIKGFEQTSVASRNSCLGSTWRAELLGTLECDLKTDLASWINELTPELRPRDYDSHGPNMNRANFSIHRVVPFDWNVMHGLIIYSLALDPSLGCSGRPLLKLDEISRARLSLLEPKSHADHEDVDVEGILNLVGAKLVRLPNSSCTSFMIGQMMNAFIYGKALAVPRRASLGIAFHPSAAEALIDVINHADDIPRTKPTVDVTQYLRKTEGPASQWRIYGDPSLVPRALNMSILRPDPRSLDMEPTKIPDPPLSDGDHIGPMLPTAMKLTEIWDNDGAFGGAFDDPCDEEIEERIEPVEDPFEINYDPEEVPPICIDASLIANGLVNPIASPGNAGAHVSNQDYAGLQDISNDPFNVSLRSLASNHNNIADLDTKFEDYVGDRAENVEGLMDIDKLWIDFRPQSISADPTASIYSLESFDTTTSSLGTPLRSSSTLVSDCPLSPTKKQEAGGLVIEVLPVSSQDSDLYPDNPGCRVQYSPRSHIAAIPDEHNMLAPTLPVPPYLRSPLDSESLSSSSASFSGASSSSLMSIEPMSEKSSAMSSHTSFFTNRSGFINTVRNFIGTVRPEKA